MCQPSALRACSFFFAGVSAAKKKDKSPLLSLRLERAQRVGGEIAKAFRLKDKGFKPGEWKNKSARFQKIQWTTDNQRRTQPTFALS